MMVALFVNILMSKIKRKKWILGFQMLEEPAKLCLSEETDETGHSEADIKLEKVLESMA